MTRTKNVDGLLEKAAEMAPLLDPEEQLARTRQHGNPTARKAVETLVRLNRGYIAPTASQKKKIVIAFAKRGRVVYGKAYDVVRIRPRARVDLDDQDSIERGLDALTLCEVKSTNRPNIDVDFNSYFFAITTAELLVAQSLKAQFRFIFVNVCNERWKEMTLQQVLARARGFYPQWSILF